MLFVFAILSIIPHKRSNFNYYFFFWTPLVLTQDFSGDGFNTLMYSSISCHSSFHSRLITPERVPVIYIVQHYCTHLPHRDFIPPSDSAVLRIQMKL